MNMSRFIVGVKFAVGTSGVYVAGGNKEELERAFIIRSHN
jgi:hypothetical protein